MDETAVKFFHEHAGFSHGPDETPEQGRQSYAEALAAAEDWAWREGYTSRWEVDPDIDSSDFSDESPPYALWSCDIGALDEPGSGLQSLGGIDLGRDGHPDSTPYARVVQAELALELYREASVTTRND
jgi:hypothetical protein